MGVQAQTLETQKVAILWVVSVNADLKLHFVTGGW
jgi:hypothetical protein